MPGEAVGQEVKKRMCLGINAGPGSCTPQSSPLLSMLPPDPHVYLGRRKRWDRKVAILLLTLSQLILVTRRAESLMPSIGSQRS